MKEFVQLNNLFRLEVVELLFLEIDAEGLKSRALGQLLGERNGVRSPLGQKHVSFRFGASAVTLELVPVTKMCSRMRHHFSIRRFVRPRVRQSFAIKA